MRKRGKVVGKLFHKKKDEVTLSPDAASQMLSNVFEACDYEANRVPLEVLQSYSNYRRERHLLQKGIIVVVALLFAMLPLLFVTPKVSANWVEGSQPGSPIYEVVADSFLPVESVRARMGAQEMDVYQVSENTYRVRPIQNGTLVITVTLTNKQSTETRVEVDGVDVTPPQLLGSSLVGDELEIFLSDDSGELDFASIYAIDADGNTVYPLRYDEERMSVTFAYPDAYLNMFISDKCKNTLQLVLTIQ